MVMSALSQWEWISVAVNGLFSSRTWSIARARLRSQTNAVLLLRLYMPIHDRNEAKEVLHNPVHDLNPLPKIVSGFTGSRLAFRIPMLNHRENAPKIETLSLTDVREKVALGILLKHEPLRPFSNANNITPISEVSRRVHAIRC